MAPGHKLNLRINQLRLERTCPSRYKNLVVLTPDSKERRLMVAEVFVKQRIQRDVVLIVKKYIELNLHVSRTIEEILIEVVCFGRDRFRVGFAREVLERSLD
jgi:hypothetical protein